MDVKKIVEDSMDRVLRNMERYGNGKCDGIYSTGFCSCIVIVDTDGYLDHYEVVGGCEDENPVHGALYAYKVMHRIVVRIDDAVLTVGEQELFDETLKDFVEKMTELENYFTSV